MGIIGFRYECNDLNPGVIEVVAYGTAVSTAAVALTNESSSTVDGQGAIDAASVCTTNTLVGRDMTRSLGVVRGITVRSRNVAANIGAGLKAGFVGGEINTWKELCDKARLDAYDRMVADAAQMGAKGIVAMRYETNELS